MTKPDSVLFLGAGPEEIKIFLNHLQWHDSPGWMRRKPDALLITDLEVYPLIGAVSKRADAYDYAHELRRELSRRKLMPVADRSIPRCQICQHGSEKIFATTETTHNIVNGEGEKIFPALCVRCWSRLHVDSDGED